MASAAARGTPQTRMQARPPQERGRGRYFLNIDTRYMTRARMMQMRTTSRQKFLVERICAPGARQALQADAPGRAGRPERALGTFVTRPFSFMLFVLSCSVTSSICAGTARHASCAAAARRTHASWAATGWAHPLVYRIEDDVLLRESLPHRLADAAQGGQTLVDGVEGLVLTRLGGLKVLRCVPRWSPDKCPRPDPGGWAPRAGSVQAAAAGHLLELGGGSAVLVVLCIVVHAVVALLRIQFHGGWRFAPAER